MLEISFFSVEYPFIMANCNIINHQLFCILVLSILIYLPSEAVCTEYHHLTIIYIFPIFKLEVNLCALRDGRIVGKMFRIFLQFICCFDM